MIKYDMTEFEDPMKDVFYGDTFESVTEEKISDQGRWYTYLSQVFQHKTTKEFWEARWTRGSTEYQECDPELELVKVSPKAVITTIYTPVEK
jgi:hypothetical protein